MIISVGTLGPKHVGRVVSFETQAGVIVGPLELVVEMKGVDIFQLRVGGVSFSVSQDTDVTVYET